MKISKYLTSEMACVSKTAKEKGIDNSIPSDLLGNAIWLGQNIYDPIIDHFSIPPLIWAIYRNSEINALAGGDPNSWHMKAAAADFDYDHLKTPTNSQLFYFIAFNLPYDKLIWELGNGKDPGWVHVQGERTGNRKLIVLNYINKDKKKVYERFNTVADFDKFKKLIYG